MGVCTENDKASSQSESFHYEPKEKPLPAEGKIRTAAYCRVSILAEEPDLSFERQCEYYSEIVTKDPGRVLAGVYADQGFSRVQPGERKEFQRLIADCENGEVDSILVKSINRFSCNTAECIEILDKLRKQGIGVYFEEEGLNSLDATCQSILSLYASFIQDQIYSQRENLRWTSRHQAEIGDPIRCRCYGYRIVKQKGATGRKWMIHAEEARRIQLMFQLAYQGYTFSEILDRMRIFEEQQGSKDYWTSERVLAALRREAYRGDILTNKTVMMDQKKAIKNDGLIDQYYIEQHHAPIVEPAIYDAVQDYIQNGYLNGRNKQIRRMWFAEHPEILNRRMEEDQ